MSVSPVPDPAETVLPPLLRALDEAGVLPSDALERLADSPASALEDAVVESGIADEHAVARAHAGRLGLAWFGLTGSEVVRHDESGQASDLGPPSSVAGKVQTTATLLGEQFCRERRCVPVAEDELACLDPGSFSTVEEARLRVGSSVRPVAVEAGLLRALLDELFGERDKVREIAAEAVLAEPVNGGPVADILDLDDGAGGHRVVRIVNAILAEAVERGASDIHLEPYEDAVRIRYRVDGVLLEASPPPPSLFVPAVSRLKILAHMDIAERRVPQDGAIALRLGRRRVDLRVATVPTVHGEKMVIRLLEKAAIPEVLTDLGFSGRQATDFMDAAAAPHGLCFVTGPTGSGKSTTLYCCLQQINRAERNILTVEDPVEYRFEGLNQVQVKSRVGLDFARSLRAFLRLDPDVIMVGEVRDTETAKICMRAALTGHLVLSTLHTNNSFQVVHRLVDMGVEPFLLGPALRLLQAQRLVRRLCLACRSETELPDATAERHLLAPSTRVWRPGDDAECADCLGTGYRGRVGLYEVVPFGRDLQEQVAGGAGEPELRAAAGEMGIETLADSARDRLLDGTTSLEEVSDYLREGM